MMSGVSAWGEMCLCRDLAVRVLEEDISKLAIDTMYAVMDGKYEAAKILLEKLLDERVVERGRWERWCAAEEAGRGTPEQYGSRDTRLGGVAVESACLKCGGKGGDMIHDLTGPKEICYWLPCRFCSGEAFLDERAMPVCD